MSAITGLSARLKHYRGLNEHASHQSKSSPLPMDTCNFNEATTTMRCRHLRRQNVSQAIHVSSKLKADESVKESLSTWKDLPDAAPARPGARTSSCETNGALTGRGQWPEDDIPLRKIFYLQGVTGI
ncbi:hypothetical protein EVAR_59191_1 [Eumeta japonica]|uniref:Uncharacterized protein n=1 Tax=Eumeta variegata TaxID=151549 RepID=A0A4C1Z7Y0_EUMVA|nr:hypothetical protein EVAR_59191_1 [Eumeta japonica]